MTRTEAYLALNLLPKIGPVRVRRLLEVFGTPERILIAKAREISQVAGFGPDLSEAIAHWETTVDLSRELRRIKEENLTLLTQEDALYQDCSRKSTILRWCSTCGDSSRSAIITASPSSDRVAPPTMDRAWRRSSASRLPMPATPSSADWRAASTPRPTKARSPARDAPWQSSGRPGKTLSSGERGPGGQDRGAGRGRE